MDYDAEVLIQDVNRVNAEIYGNGHMYVGGAIHMQNPLYFAPYFSQENEKPGLYDVSRVLWVESANIHKNGVEKQFARWFKSEPEMREYRERWEKYWHKGLQLILQRAKKEKWNPKDENRLYFLDHPLTIRMTPLMKCEKLRQIPRNYSLDFVDVLTLQRLGCSLKVDA